MLAGLSKERMMTVDEFRVAEAGEFEGPLLALWWDGRGNWEKAHEVAQEVDGADGAWVHAYLHRKEGDAGNAAYWYRRAGRPVARGELKEEWERMVEELLERRG
jgi:hypothetical protein